MQLVFWWLFLLESNVHVNKYLVSHNILVNIVRLLHFVGIQSLLFILRLTKGGVIPGLSIPVFDRIVGRHSVNETPFT